VFTATYYALIVIVAAKC